jgi:hypothetical protein
VAISAATARKGDLLLIDMGALPLIFLVSGMVAETN